MNEKKCNKNCESCLMPLGKNLEHAGTESNGDKNQRYCKYCYQNGKLNYEGNDLKTFQAMCYKGMREKGMNFLLAKFYTWMIRFAPRWKKS